MSDFQIDENRRQALQTTALRYYEVPGRFYHDYSHIYAMMDAHRKYFASEPSDALHIAILMHDAVYIPGSSPMSEDASQALIPQFYFQALHEPIPQALNDKVNELIHWTLPAYHVKDNRQRFKSCSDAMKLLDLDLNAMSERKWDEFIRTQYKIDREFQHLGTLEERCNKSADFLEQFVKKGFVYYSPQMEHLNPIALCNLRAYIQIVRSGETDFTRMFEADPMAWATAYEEANA